MCGIAGVLKIHPLGTPPPPHHEAIPEAWLDILDDSIKHRGPDGAGRFRDRATRPDGTVVDVAFVHRRLSIIDHAGGSQPMVHVRHADGSGELLQPDAHGTIDATHMPQGTDLVAVVFNGCIYNHRDLRAELETLGHRFCTDHSDTEVLIHGWRAWGGAYAQPEAMHDGSTRPRHLGVFSRAEGMWATLIWDRRRGTVHAVQDKFREKPLWSVEYSGRFELMHVGVRVFASAATSVIDMRHRLERPELFLWCKERGGGTPRWACHGRGFPHLDCINRHAPIARTSAELRSLDGEPIKPDWIVTGYLAVTAEYMKATSSTRRATPSPDDVDAAIHRSVKARLEADVPVGLFLSGGVDSAIIAAHTAQLRDDAAAFTVRMPHPEYDESAAASETAARLGIEHHILDCEAEPARDLVELIETLGAPFGDSSLLPTYWVCRAAKQCVSVALSGDGADELFAGYDRHTIAGGLAAWRPLLRLVPSWLLPQRDPRSRFTRLARLGTAARAHGYDALPDLFVGSDRARLFGQHPAPRLVADFIGAMISGAAESLRVWFIGPAAFRRATAKALETDLWDYLPNDLLMKTDTASMHCALEVRCPYLDSDVVHLARTAKINALMPHGQRKGLLKQVAAKYLPPHIINRPKRGFAIPIGDWFRTDYGGLRQLLHDHLHSAEPFPGLADAGVAINMGFVHKMLRQHDAAGERSPNPWHGRDHSQRLYMLLVLSIWCRWLDRLRRAERAGPGDEVR